MRQSARNIPPEDIVRISRLMLFVVLILTLPGFSQNQPAAKAASSSAKSAANTAVPSKALMQKIWDAWATLDPANVASYYAKGAGHTFFDIAPLKYDSWEEYEKGVKQVISGFQSLKPTVNDARLHRHADLVWATAIVHADEVMKDGTKQQGDMRWTVVWQKLGPNWLIVHEHVSVPLAAPSPGEKH